jgi:hypothetical protein
VVRGISAAIASAVLTLAVSVPVTSGVAALAPASVLPARLVGTWTRKVTTADVARADAARIFEGSVCTLSVKESSSPSNFHLFCKGVGYKDGEIIPAGANRVHIGPRPNLYSWEVSDHVLTFTKISDPVRDRVAIFSGSWTQK